MVKSYEKVTGWGNTLGLSIIRHNAQISCTSKGQGWSSGTGSVLKNPFRNSVLTEFMTTLIHILCSNFKEIGCREVSLNWWQKVQKMRFSLPFCTSLAEGAKCDLSLCKIASQSVPVCQSYFRKMDFTRPHYMPSAQAIIIWHQR